MKKLLNTIKENKAFIFPWVVLIALVVILASGITYAYFDFVTDEENESSMRITVTDLKVKLSMTNVNLSNMMPIYDDYKDTQANTFNFTMSNTSRKLAGCVDLFLNVTSITEELKSPDFKFELKNTTNNTTSTGNFSSIDESGRLLLKANENIPIGTTYSYTLKIWYSFSDYEDQSFILGASMTSKLLSIAYGGACNTPVSTTYSTVGTTQFTAPTDGYYRIETYNVNGDYASGEILLNDNEKLYFNVSNTSGTPTSVSCYLDETTKSCSTQGSQDADNSRIMYAKTNVSNSFMSGYAGSNAPISTASGSELSYNTLHPTGKFFLNGKMAFATSDTTPKVVVTYLGKYKERNELLDNVRYVKDCVSGNTANNYNHWIEIQAIKNGVNIAYKKPVSGSTTSQIVDDGIITTSPFAGSTPNCVTIDLGRTYDLDEVAVWHYYGDGRTYHNNITSVSSNNSTWTEIRNETETGEVPETANGKRTSAYETSDNTLYKVLADMAVEGTYAAAYNGAHNDTYGQVGSKKIYYIKTTTENDATEANTLLQMINVKFAGFCWQMLRTTDTGGVKLIYNGSPNASGQCLSHNTYEEGTTHNAIRATQVSGFDFSSNYMYADSFTYSIANRNFTLVNPSSDNYTNGGLIGKYTCRGASTTTCSRLYKIFMDNPADGTKPFVEKFDIVTGIRNPYIAVSDFESAYGSPSGIGYMTAGPYRFTALSSPPDAGSIVGNDVVWDGNNYRLTVPSGENINTSTTLDNTHHYTCNTTSSICTDGVVRYYPYPGTYFELKNGETIESFLYKMLTLNTHSSLIKRVIDKWYSDSLSSYTTYLDQGAVYCNERSVINYGGWSKNGAFTVASASDLRFKNYNLNAPIDLNCENNTDKFSTSNSSAQLTYPVGMATLPELRLVNNLNVTTVDLGASNGYSSYYLMTPSKMINGTNSYPWTNRAFQNRGFEATTGTWGVRPVIVLKPGTKYVQGKGTLADPYVVQ